VHHARIVVLELDDASGRLAELAQSVDRVLHDYGVPIEERSFRPHVTLARLKHACDARQWLRRDLGPMAASCDLAALALYRSDPQPDGPRYTSLTRFALRGGPE
jgi:2'-5' RNA ligase